MCAFFLSKLCTNSKVRIRFQRYIHQVSNLIYRRNTNDPLISKIFIVKNDYTIIIESMRYLMSDDGTNGAIIQCPRNIG